MRRLRSTSTDERGATAVIVALLMVALLGFAAISIDVGKLYWERAQLQNAADAGALALAGICGKNESAVDCSNTSGIPLGLATANSHDAQSLVTGITVDKPANTALVKTSASETGATANSVSLWFAQALGFKEAQVGAQAAASWGPPGSLDAKFPLAFSDCEIDSSPVMDGQLQFLQSHGSGNVKPDPCHLTGSGQEAPGGFGWLVQEPSESCTVDTVIGGWEASDTGNNFKSGCEARLKTWQDTLKAGGEVIALFPVMSKSKGSGNNTEYYVSAYVAFDVKGWHFKNNDALLDYLPGTTSGVIAAGGFKNSNLGFVGKFVRYVFNDEEVTPGTGTSPYGANIVTMTK
jgi:hypothetical protein